jgi:hypothetical protein
MVGGTKNRCRPREFRASQRARPRKRRFELDGFVRSETANVRQGDKTL